MPMYDYRCPFGHETESLERIGTERTTCRVCHLEAWREWRSFANVIGDEIDWWDDNIDTKPVHFTSKIERRRMMKEKGVQEYLRHVGEQGSDRSKHTTRWY